MLQHFQLRTYIFPKSGPFGLCFLVWEPVALDWDLLSVEVDSLVIGLIFNGEVARHDTELVEGLVKDAALQGLVQ